MRNNGRNTVKTRLATRNTYSSRNSSSTRYGRNTYSSSRNYGSRNYSNYGMNNAERGYYSSNRYNYTSEALDYAQMQEYLLLVSLREELFLLELGEGSSFKSC